MSLKRSLRPSARGLSLINHPLEHMYQHTHQRTYLLEHIPVHLLVPAYIRACAHARNKTAGGLGGVASLKEETRFLNTAIDTTLEMEEVIFNGKKKGLG